jgi:hypothetical protein
MTVLAFSASPARKDSVPMAVARIAPLRSRKGESGEFRLIFVLTFTIFLVVAMVERVLPSSWRSHSFKVDAGKSVFGEARSAARTFVPFAFMG